MRPPPTRPRPAPPGPRPARPRPWPRPSPYPSSPARARRRRSRVARCSPHRSFGCPVGVPHLPFTGDGDGTRRGSARFPPERRTEEISGDHPRGAVLAALVAVVRHRLQESRRRRRDGHAEDE
ncbi:hypothetical protein B6E66_09455 [Streptomyces maremycinicus]|nr:hypothetical protein B6E66_09455 [Streptomyces sp. B9173]